MRKIVKAVIMPLFGEKKHVYITDERYANIDNQADFYTLVDKIQVNEDNSVTMINVDNRGNNVTYLNMPSIVWNADV